MFTFTFKQNFRTPGSEITISNEGHTVSSTSPYVIKLVEVPLRTSPSTVVIPGYSESLSNNPPTNSYFVNYSTGYVIFNVAAAGQAVSVSYYGRGSIVDAIDVDDIQDVLGPLLNSDGTFADEIVRPNNISTNGSDAFVFPFTIDAASDINTATQYNVGGVQISTTDLSDGSFIIFTSTSLGGDLSGFLPSPTVSEINGNLLGSTGVTDSNLLIADGSQWNSVAMSGDVTIDDTGIATLSATGVTASTYGDNVNVGQFTVNAKGLITSAANVSISGVLSGVTGLGSQSQDLDLNSHFIHNVTDPVLAQDAATKNYVDSTSSGLHFKQAVLYATAAALPTYTYFNGVSGVGATITEVGFGALSVDGITSSVSDRVLIKDEVSTNAPYNGVYTVTVAGDTVTSFVLTRATDYDQSSEIAVGDAFFVKYGTVNATSAWVQTTTGTITVGTTDIVFVQGQGGLNFTAGTGLTLIGTQFSLTTPVTIALGGTSATTQQTAINNLTGTQSSGKYLRSDGTNATLSFIQAADVPTLNQNTTGNADTATTAYGLKTTTTTVVVSGATAPTAGQVLTATSSTAAEWSNKAPTWTKYTVAYTALSTAATINNIELFSLPAKGVIHQVKIKHSTAFSGGAISNYTISVGISGFLDKYAEAFSVFTATSTSNIQLSQYAGTEDESSSTSIKISAVSVGANLSAATAGSVDVWVLTSVTP